jgi:hypothetical protein
LQHCAVDLEEREAGNFVDRRRQIMRFVYIDRDPVRIVHAIAYGDLQKAHGPVRGHQYGISLIHQGLQG